MNRKYGLRQITLFLSVCVSVFSACICVLLMANEYYTARNKLDMYSKESQGWEACRQTEPTYFEANAEAVSNCLKNLEEAKNNFWATLPKNQVITLFVLAGLGSAIGGYLAVWSVWFCGTGVYRFIGWVKLCWQSKSFRSVRRVKAQDIVKEFEEPKEYHLEKDVERKERTYEEDLEHQVEMLREEVCSVRSDLEKYKNKDDCKSDTAKDELTF
ncbi:MAG: hypothetical protein RQ760_06220 [Sedimentisphaerales bacterium]|nr:hypothetical protein [Sedimentisphaerales bacterium]